MNSEENEKEITKIAKFLNKSNFEFFCFLEVFLISYNESRSHRRMV